MYVYWPRASTKELLSGDGPIKAGWRLTEALHFQLRVFSVEHRPHCVLHRAVTGSSSLPAGVPERREQLGAPAVVDWRWRPPGLRHRVGRAGGALYIGAARQGVCTGRRQEASTTPQWRHRAATCAQQRRVRPRARQAVLWSWVGGRNGDFGLIFFR